MSGTDIIGALLFAHAPLIAIVPKGKIKVEEVPIESAPPFIILELVDGTGRKVLNQPALRRRRQRITVTVCAAGVAQREQLIELVRDACCDRLGDIGGFTAVDVQADFEHPPIRIELPPSANIYTRGQDFQVSFNQAA